MRRRCTFKRVCSETTGIRVRDNYRFASSRHFRRHTEAVLSCPTGRSASTCQAACKSRGRTAPTGCWARRPCQPAGPDLVVDQGRGFPTITIRMHSPCVHPPKALNVMSRVLPARLLGRRAVSHGPPLESCNSRDSKLAAGSETEPAPLTGRAHLTKETAGRPGAP